MRYIIIQLATCIVCLAGAAAAQDSQSTAECLERQRHEKCLFRVNNPRSHMTPQEIEDLRGLCEEMTFDYTYDHTGQELMNTDQAMESAIAHNRAGRFTEASIILNELYGSNIRRGDLFLWLAYANLNLNTSAFYSAKEAFQTNPKGRFFSADLAYQVFVRTFYWKYLYRFAPTLFFPDELSVICGNDLLCYAYFREDREFLYSSLQCFGRHFLPPENCPDVLNSSSSEPMSLEDLVARLDQDSDDGCRWWLSELSDVLEEAPAVEWADFIGGG